MEMVLVVGAVFFEGVEIGYVCLWFVGLVWFVVVVYVVVLDVV